MQYLFEYTDTINHPYEAFMFDASKSEFPIRPHFHYFMEIIYMLTGSAMAECNGKSYVLENGDMIIFYPENVHAIYAVTGFPIIYDVLKFDVNKLHAPNSYTPRFGKIFQAARTKKMTQVFRRNVTEKLHIKNYFDSCIKELYKHNFGYDMAVHNNVENLLINIIRQWQQCGFTFENISVSTQDNDSISSITSYIDEHSSEDISVNDMAKRCGMSYSFFAKKFHELYGRSCKEYIELMRVIKAEDMLLFTEYDLSWIAQETGFSDSSHLIKLFRRFKQSTPKQFRLEHRNAKQI